MSTRQEVYKLIIEKKDNKEIAAALNISIRTVERYRKDFNDTTNDDKNATATNDNRRKKKEKARALIESGETIREVGDKLGLSKSVAGRLSSKEKLQVNQLNYLKSFREQYREEITKNKKDRLNLNNIAKEKIEYTLNLAEDISKDTQKLIEMNEETEQKIFELDRIERLEKLELERNKFKNDLLIDFTEKIQKLTDENIMKVLEFMKSLESDTDESAN